MDSRPRIVLRIDGADACGQIQFGRLRPGGRGSAGAALRLAPDPASSANVGRLLLRVRAGGHTTSVNDANELVRDVGRPFRLTHKIVLGLAVSRRALAVGQLR